jgi:hypothetical protein
MKLNQFDSDSDSDDDDKVFIDEYSKEYESVDKSNEEINCLSQVSITQLNNHSAHTNEMSTSSSSSILTIVNKNSYTNSKTSTNSSTSQGEIRLINSI